MHLTPQKTLTDAQLFALSKLKRLPACMRQTLAEELSVRQFTPVYNDQLEVAFNKRGIPKDSKPLTSQEKILFMIVSVAFPIPMIAGLLLLRKGEFRKWKQHWAYVMLGTVLWCGIVLIASRYWLLKA